MRLEGLTSKYDNTHTTHVYTHTHTQHNTTQHTTHVLKDYGVWDKSVESTVYAFHGMLHSYGICKMNDNLIKIMISQDMVTLPRYHTYYHMYIGGLAWA